MSFTAKDLEKFMDIDGGWEKRVGGNHVVCVKYLDDKRYQVGLCHDKKKTFRVGTAQKLCKEQLGLPGGLRQFQEVLRTGVAPDRSGPDLPDTDHDLMTTQTADLLLYECKMGQYQVKDFTQSQGEKLVTAHRFGSPVGSMDPEHVQTALDVIEEYGIDDDFESYQVFEAASGGFSPDEIQELMSLERAQTPSLSQLG